MSGSDTTVTNLPSPETAEAMRFRLGEATSARDNIPGGAGYFTNPANSPYKVTPEMGESLANMRSTARNAPGDPWENPALQAYGPAAVQIWNQSNEMPGADAWVQGAMAGSRTAGSPIVGPQMHWGPWAQAASQWASRAQAPIATPTMNYGAASGIDYEATPASYDPVAVGHQSPVDIARIDPTRALEAAQNHLRLVSAPEIQNAMQARGMGNSGAEAEAMALAGARMVLPIEEQILGSEHEVNMMEGQILARQQEVELLEQQKAALQSQALTAQSYDQAQAINAQLAQVEAQLNTALAQTEYTGQIQASIAQRNAEMGFGSQLLGQTAGLMDTEFSGQTQQAIAQRNAELGYSQGILGTAANLMGTQYQGRTATGNQILNNTMQAGLSLPGMRSQWYNDRMTGAEADFQAASVPQQMAMQDYINKQNFYQSMVGAVPSGNLGFPGATNSSNNGPQWGQITNALGNAALIGSMYMDKS